MINVNQLITNLLNERISKKMDNLEQRFGREASDLSQLDINMNNLKSKRKK